MQLTSSVKNILLSALCIAVSGPGVLTHPTSPEAPPAPSTTKITPPPLELLLDPEILRTHEFTVPCGCWNECTLLNVAAGGRLLAPNTTWSNETNFQFPACDPGWCIPEYLCRYDGTTPVPDDDVPKEPGFVIDGGPQNPKANEDGGITAGGRRRSLHTATAQIDKRGCIWIVCCTYEGPRPGTDDIDGSIACTIDPDRFSGPFWDMDGVAGGSNGGVAE